MSISGGFNRSSQMRRNSGGRKGAVELRDLCDALRAGKWRRATLGEWFYRFEQMLNQKLDEAERLLDRKATSRVYCCVYFDWPLSAHSRGPLALPATVESECNSSAENRTGFNPSATPYISCK